MASKSSHLHQNKDPNILQTKGSSQSVGNIYKNNFTNLDKNVSLKPANTFERFLKNLTQSSMQQTQSTGTGFKETGQVFS